LISPFYMRSSIRTIEYCNIVTEEKYVNCNRIVKGGTNVPWI
jgi:hypothetical protein